MSGGGQFGVKSSAGDKAGPAAGRTERVVSVSPGPWIFYSSGDSLRRRSRISSTGVVSFLSRLHASHAGTIFPGVPLAAAGQGQRHGPSSACPPPNFFLAIMADPPRELPLPATATALELPGFLPLSLQARGIGVPGIKLEITIGAICLFPIRFRSGPYTANRKCITSPSRTTYSLPSRRMAPASRMACSLLCFIRSSKL